MMCEVHTVNFTVFYTQFEYSTHSIQTVYLGALKNAIIKLKNCWSQMHLDNSEVCLFDEFDGARRVFLLAQL